MRYEIIKKFLFTLLLLSFFRILLAHHPDTIVVEQLLQAPTIDGLSADWSITHLERQKHLKLEVLNSFVTSPDEMRYNVGWDPAPNLRAGIHQDTLYLLVSWQDDKADTIYRPWTRMGPKWRRGRQKDDMFSIRFDLDGDFNSCMLSDKDYSVDIWRWSAGRSALSDYADDMWQSFSTTKSEQAAEYPFENHTVYIQSRPDPGTQGWAFSTKPKIKDEALLPGVSKKTPSGGVADIYAKGNWVDGRWTLELSRKLKTADPLDIEIKKGSTHTIQLAFFNAGYRLRKQITQPLTLDLTAIK